MLLMVILQCETNATHTVSDLIDDLGSTPDVRKSSSKFSSLLKTSYSSGIFLNPISDVT